MAWREFVDVSENGRRRNRAPVSEYLVQAVDINLSRDRWMSEERFDLGPEEEGLICLGVEERPYA
jgi:hypothetical protein